MIRQTGTRGVGEGSLGLANIVLEGSVEDMIRSRLMLQSKTNREFVREFGSVFRIFDIPLPFAGNAEIVSGGLEVDKTLDAVPSRLRFVGLSSVDEVVGLETNGPAFGGRKHEGTTDEDVLVPLHGGRQTATLVLNLQTAEDFVSLTSLGLEQEFEARAGSDLVEGEVRFDEVVRVDRTSKLGGNCALVFILGLGFLENILCFILLPFLAFSRSCEVQAVFCFCGHVRFPCGGETLGEKIIGALAKRREDWNALRVRHWGGYTG